ncbi:CBS domain-containing protein [Streptomyces sp. L2]|uniref:CBS domain-containing protein n=1 Tax=Streptomyces sp. L2 TaxID=2162665 RepID=UPI0010133061|nr:CBS domain-containing protein [Streptomyces sp. L2]
MKPTEIGAFMTDEVVTARYGTPFKEVVRLLRDHRISGLPVIDDDKVIGVISETDLMRHQAAPVESAGRLATRARRLSRGALRSAAPSTARTAGGLTSTPTVTVRARAALPVAARLMTRRGIERLPVVDEEDRLVGIITRRDLLGVFLHSDEEIEQAVRREVFADALWLSPHIAGVTVHEGVVTLTGQLERRGDVTAAAGPTRRLDGVVDVVNHLTYHVDDRFGRPAEPVEHTGPGDGRRAL